jgi:putative oxidoreductase
MHHPLMAHLRRPGNADWATFVLRLALGSVMVYHGYPKLFVNAAGTVAFFSKIGIPAAGFFAPFVGLVEFFGGLLLILGLGVRLWGLALAIDMAVAILVAKGLSSWKGLEFELSLMAMAVSLLLTGGGACSLDAWLMKRGKAEHEAAMPAPPAAKT